VDREQRSVPYYVLVQDIASSWAEYELRARPLVDPLPDGLMLHVAGATDEGVRIINIWDSEDSWQRFRTERLGPAIAALGGPARRQPTSRDLRPSHIVIGPGLSHQPER
jgi:hypothetical protein